MFVLWQGSGEKIHIMHRKINKGDFLLSIHVISIRKCKPKTEVYWYHRRGETKIRLLGSLLEEKHFKSQVATILNITYVISN